MMAADRNSLIAEALDEALLLDEIRSGAREAMIDNADLRSAVYESLDTIWNTFQAQQLSDGTTVQRYSGHELKYALLNRGLLPFLRSVINEALQIRSSNIIQLPDIHVMGLSQIADPIYNIRTTASMQLDRLIEGLEGGSIAISGPPGVGKSTLLRSPVDRPVPQRKPFLAEFVNVRTEDPRAFLLSLLEALCRRVADPRYVKALDELLDPIRADRSIIGQILPFWPLFMFVGGLLIALSIANVKVDSRAAWGSAFLATGVLLGLSFYWPRLRGLRLFRSYRWRRRTANADLGIEQAARGLLTDIVLERRYQRSYTAGSSMKLKLPVGLEAGTTGSTTLTRLERSMVDLVISYTSFMKLLARNGPIFILVDGADEIESLEKLRSLLVEIGPIFRIEGCYYLMTVSDKSLVHLKGRGLPFDAVVTIEALHLRESTQLLQRRVIGLPSSFIALCHCISAGFAPDLIGTAREVFESAYAAEVRDLADVSRLLVKTRVSSAIESAIVDVEGIELEPEASLVLDWCNRLDLTNLSAPQLLNHCRWLESMGDLVGSASTEGKSLAERWKLFRIASELATNDYYYATILEIFGSELDQERFLKEASLEAGLGSFDSLARSRQLSTAHAWAGWAAISSVRGAWNLEMLNFPGVHLKSQRSG